MQKLFPVEINFGKFVLQKLDSPLSFFMDQKGIKSERVNRSRRFLTFVLFLARAWNRLVFFEFMLRGTTGQQD
jgi:hypothetical protein